MQHWNTGNVEHHGPLWQKEERSLRDWGPSDAQLQRTYSVAMAYFYLGHLDCILSDWEIKSSFIIISNIITSTILD